MFVLIYFDLNNKSEQGCRTALICDLTTQHVSSIVELLFYFDLNNRVAAQHWYATLQYNTKSWKRWATQISEPLNVWMGVFIQSWMGVFKHEWMDDVFIHGWMGVFIHPNLEHSNRHSLFCHQCCCRCQNGLALESLSSLTNRWWSRTKTCLLLWWKISTGFRFIFHSYLVLQCLHVTTIKDLYGVQVHLW